jgi:hypothetical protein
MSILVNRSTPNQCQNQERIKNKSINDNDNDNDNDNNQNVQELDLVSRTAGGHPEINVVETRRLGSFPAAPKAATGLDDRFAKSTIVALLR